MYKCFIDDSGSKDYINPFCPKLKECLPEWEDNRKWLNDNFFGLSGIHLKTSSIGAIDKDIKDLKKKYFGTEHVEIKSVYLRSPKLSKRHYIDVFSITKEQLKEFGDGIYEILEKHKSNYCIFATIFDKRHYKYRDNSDANCLLKSTQVFLERIHFSELETTLVFDQMESSLSKEKGKHGEMLKIYANNSGMKNSYVLDFKNIIDIEFQKSDTENMLQIADILAYNIRRQFMEYGRCMIDGNCTLNHRGNMECGEYEYFNKISDRIYSSGGKVIGRGLVVIPNWKKLNWSFGED